MKNSCLILSSITVHIILTISNCASQSTDPDRLQAVHVLNPGITNFSSYLRWNSDEWINWLRLRFATNFDGGRGKDGEDEKVSLGKWVNIILITNEDELYSAFEETSTPAYPGDDTRSEYYWSNTPFPVYVIIRKPPPSPPVADEDENMTEPESQYAVYDCSDKPMFINAKVDPVTHKPIFIQTIFPKRVKNPKISLRIPLTTCKKVRKRGLLDEINLLFRSQ